MKILVLQEYGQAGQLLLERLEKTSLDVTPLLLSRVDEMPLSKVASWLPAEIDLLVNTVTLTNPQWAEDHPAACRHRLLELPKVLADACKSRDITMLQLSSCYVFDGRKQQAYITSNPGQPIGLLGQCQWEMEQYLRANLPRHLILRTGWSLRRFIRLLTSGSERLLLSSRYQGQPTATEDLNRVITAILQQLDCGAEGWGTFQYAGAEEVTLYELGQIIQETLELAQPAQLVDDGEAWSRLEPENATLGCLKIRNTFGIKQRSWRQDIADEYGLMCREESHGTREKSVV